MKIKEILIVVGILVAALAAWIIMEVTKTEGTQVVVRINGEEVATYPLDVDGQFELNGGTNILCIENGKAFLIDATCPDHLCVKQGAISFNGETITCLPNRLTVTVTGGEDPDVDLVS